MFKDVVENCFMLQTLDKRGVQGRRHDEKLFSLDYSWYFRVFI